MYPSVGVSKAGVRVRICCVKRNIIIIREYYYSNRFRSGKQTIVACIDDSLYTLDVYVLVGNPGQGGVRSVPQFSVEFTSVPARSIL